MKGNLSFFSFFHSLLMFCLNFRARLSVLSVWHGFRIFERRNFLFINQKIPKNYEHQTIGRPRAGATHSG